MNEIQQIFGITNYFVITGIVLSGIWAGAYILSWIIQWAWAWVDETPANSFNWVVKTFGSGVSGWVHTSNYWAYRKYSGGIEIDHTDNIGRVLAEVKEFEILTKEVFHKTNAWFPYISYIFWIWFSILCANFWYISMWFAMAISLAFITRMARRGHKMLQAHISDKDAHK